MCKYVCVRVCVKYIVAEWKGGVTERIAKKKERGFGKWI